ncbi:hypothetical protein JQ615_39650 [Bradyrhizobium jicamae]|uniref:Alkaline proteinase inhibitor/ Outer membrane lipoprotein Omp19 domain-containing protein n=1 Tax=Bradyrhizobium jicamae TaxID=280332 RepID=A0ABS5FXL8_9BRAD|nr:hypothetical protein [Bradyrhizobium jicamae]MBR0801476.1 hypothetical protein [Bradyrhizobium jicamae]
MRTSIIGGLLLAGAAASANAAPVEYLGNWTIASSQPAPWAEANEKPVASDLKALIGHGVIFRTDRIEAPPPLGCRKPHYAIKSYEPDMLFQGGLTDPKPQAASLGFSGATIPTLETGCEGAIDFHFPDGNTALFGLNNRIYKLVRTRPAGQ